MVQVELRQQPGQYMAHAMPPQAADGIGSPWRAVAPGMTFPPRCSGRGWPQGTRPPFHQPAPSQPPTSCPPWRMSVTMPDNIINPGMMYSTSNCQLYFALTAPTNVLAPPCVSRGGMGAHLSSSSGGDGPNSFMSGHGATSFPGSSSPSSFPSSSGTTVTLPSCMTGWPPTDLTLTDESTAVHAGSRLVAQVPPGASQPLAPVMHAGGGRLAEMHPRPMLHQSQLSHRQGGPGLQDALRARIHSMRAVPNLQLDATVGLQAQFGAIVAARVADSHPQTHPQDPPVHHLAAAIGESPGQVAAAKLTPAAGVPGLHRDPSHAFHQEQVQQTQKRSADRPVCQPVVPSQFKDGPGDHGVALGDAVELGSAPQDWAGDIVGYLLGNSSELCEGAFLDSNSFDKSGSGSGAGKSGSGSGGKGSGGSRGGNSRPSSPPR